MRYKDENSPDRPVIEVTPAMIEAGLVALRDYDWDEGMNKSDAVRQIVTAALLARRLSLGR